MSGYAHRCRSLPYTACGSVVSVTTTPNSPSSPAATHAYLPTKFMNPVPCMSNWPIHALLSLFFDRWQSVHCLVSRTPRPRTVCGTFVLNATPPYPSAEMVCCCT